MSKPKQRRRVVLPTLLALGMTSGAGVGGYLLYDQQPGQLSPQAQGDLEAGFESAQGNDTLGAMASAWKRETSAVVPASAIEAPAEAAGEAPVATTFDEEPAKRDRYADVEPTPAAELPPLAVASAADEPATIAADEPHSASDTIARGQSPSLPPFEQLPADNPLRAEADPFGPVGALPMNDSQGQAAQAFAEPAPLPMAELEPTAPLPQAQPMSATEGNPLRGVPQPAAQAGQPAPAPFADARPMMAQDNLGLAEADRYAGQFDEQPMTDLAAEEPMGQAERSPEYAELDEAALEPEPYAADPAAPMASPEAYNAFDPTPVPAGRSAPAIDEGTGRPGEIALEGPQRPSLVLQKFAPAEIQVGKECKFVVKVRNVGQRPADNVVVQDEVPQGTRFLSASPAAEASGSTLSWQLGTLSPGEERTVEMTLMPTDEGEIGSVAQVTFASHASAKTRCTRPQLALRMTAPSEVLIGRQQRLTIELHNPGTGDATGVMLLENVPENVRHQAGPALEFEIGTLRAGETRRMELVLTAEKPGRVVNVLTARADGNLQVQQEVEFEVISPALSVGVNGPARRYLERPATYTVSVDNPGTAPAKDVQLIAKLPKGMRFARANNMGEYDSATHSVYWSLAELPEGQQGTVELVALPVQSGDHTIEIEGRAREGLEDRTTQPVRIEGLAAIMFTVADANDPIEVGGTTSYEIRVVNQGSKAATNVQVSALVPQGMAVTNVLSETRHAVEAEGVVFGPLDRLAPKAEAIFRIDVQGVRPGDQRLMVEVRTDDIEQPIRKEESTRVFGDE